MSTVAEITTELTNGLSGKNIGIKGNLKYDFGSDGIIFIECTGTEAIVSNEDKDAEFTAKMSTDTWDSLKEGTVDPFSAVMNGDIIASGDVSLGQKIQVIFDSVK